MSNIKNPFGFWGGLVSIIFGLVLLYFAVDFNNTNLNTAVYPALIKAGLQVLGFAFFGIGVLMMIIGYFRRPTSKA